MDALDTKALVLLCHNGRVSWADLAQQLNLSAPATAERIRKLEERGVIRGYTAVLHPPALGYRMTALVGVTLAKSKHHKPFVRAIRKLPEVLECYRVTGEDDYHLKLIVRDAAHLDVFLVKSLRTLEGVQHVRTTVVLSALKENSFGREEPPQLAISD